MIDRISLIGKVALITGGASGIGLATSHLLAGCGATVVTCDLGCMQPSTASALALVGDVSSERDCDHIVQATIEHYGRIDVLVNSAGILELNERTVRQDLAAWRKVMDVNLQGTYLMARATARTMVEGGIRGSIINLSSVAGLIGFRASNAYGVSKAAVAMLTKTLAADLGSRSIRVNAVAPGFIHTPMTANMQLMTKVDQGKFVDRIPLGHFGESKDVARAILFLASDWASYVTGSVLSVDGGWSAFGGPSD